MAELKTKKNEASVEDFLNSVADEKKKADGLMLLKIFKKVTKEEPKMWGASIVGFGQYHYKSERSSQQGDWPLVGFSPRKQNLTLYLIAGFDKLADLLGKLGKHKTSVGCLYINKLSDVDLDVLEKVIEKALVEMKSYTESNSYISLGNIKDIHSFKNSLSSSCSLCILAPISSNT